MCYRVQTENGVVLRNHVEEFRTAAAQYAGHAELLAAQPPPSEELASGDAQRVVAAERERAAEIATVHQQRAVIEVRSPHAPTHPRPC